MTTTKKDAVESVSLKEYEAMKAKYDAAIAANRANKHDFRVVSESAYRKNKDARQMHRSVSAEATKTLLANKDNCEYVVEVAKSDDNTITFIVVKDSLRELLTNAMNTAVRSICE